MNIIIPGLHNSDESHWQSQLQKLSHTPFHRVQQVNWDEPDCETWINRIEADLQEADHSKLILIGHSIGCIAIIKWYEKFGHKIKGALLVAPSDSEKESYPTYIRGFIPIPKAKLPFPSIVVGSTNDHVTSMERTKEFANNWGSRIVILDNAGHIEPKSGFGNWPLGLALINELEFGAANGV